MDTKLLYAPEDGEEEARPAFVTSQFHGCNIAMSWFLIVQNINNHTYKLIQWGTGQEVPAQLYDLTEDPGEVNDLWNTTSPSADTKALFAQLDANLQTTINYTSVAQDVAQYNKDSFLAWVNVTDNWEAAIHASGLRWDDSWDYDPAGALAAVKAWSEAPAKVVPCRANLTWNVSLF